MKKIQLLFFIFAFYQLAHAQSDGSLDINFGSAGKVTLDNGNGGDDEAYGVTKLNSGNIILAGVSYITSYDLAFCAFNEDGSVNNSFGINGLFTLDIENNSLDYIEAVSADSNQLIVGVGYSIIGADEYMIVVRINADGTPDENFGTNGIVKLNPSLANVAYDMAIQPDGKILIGGYVDDGLTQEKPCVIRLNDDGTIDGTFGDNGVWEGSPDVSNDAIAYALELQPDGKILIAGMVDQSNGTDKNFFCGRITASGAVDAGFNNNGWLVKNISSGNDDIAQDIALQSDGKILLAGSSNGRIAIGRLNSDGTADTDFGNSGFKADALQSGSDQLYCGLTQSDGRILLGGLGSNNGWDFLLVRLNEADGAFDSSFGDDGVVYTDFNSNDDLIHQLLFQPDGKIIAAGRAGASSGTDFALARYSNGFTAVTGIQPAAQLCVYPNPACDDFTLDLKRFAGRTIAYSMVDETGRILLTGNFPATQRMISVSLPSFSDGVYIIEVADDEENMVARQKLVIRK